MCFSLQYYCTFLGCVSLRSIVIPDSVTKIESEAFHGCRSLESVVMSERVEEICEAAFRGCCSLIDIALPAPLYAIEINAFKDCNSLSMVYFNGTTPPWCAYPVFENVADEFVVYVPQSDDGSVLEAYRGTRALSVVADAITTKANM